MAVRNISTIKMKFTIIIMISFTILCPTLPYPCIPSSPKTLANVLGVFQNLVDKQMKLSNSIKEFDNQTKLENVIKGFVGNQTKLDNVIKGFVDDQTKLVANQKKLDNEIKEIYQLILDNNDDIPITYRPEVIEWLRKQNQLDRKSFLESAPIVVDTPCIRFIRFPKFWQLGNQFQGDCPGLVVKYNKNQTRAIVFPIGHAHQNSSSVIPISLPNNQGRTSYILVDQIQNICGRNVGPAMVGTLSEDMWEEIYKNYPFLKE